MLGLDLAEELLVLGIRTWEAALDEMHAQIGDAGGHAHLLVYRDTQPLALHAVAQGGVVQQDAARRAHRAFTGVPVLRAYSWNLAMMLLVIGPGTPAPILRRSTSTTGPTSAALPVRKASSAL